MMNRAEREALIAKLQADNADTFAEMAARRAQLGHDVFEPPLHRKSPRQSLVFKVHDELPELPPTSTFVDDAFLQEALERTVTVIGEEVGAVERRIILKQDAELTALRSEVSDLRGELADLRETVATLGDDLAALRDDMNAIEERSGSGAARSSLLLGGEHVA